MNLVDNDRTPPVTLMYRALTGDQDQKGAGIFDIRECHVPERDNKVLKDEVKLT